MYKKNVVLPNGDKVLIVRPVLTLGQDIPIILPSRGGILSGDFDLDPSFIDDLYFHNEHDYSRIEIITETYSRLSNFEIIKNSDTSKIELIQDEDNKNKVSFSFDGEYVGDVHISRIFEAIDIVIFNK